MKSDIAEEAAKSARIAQSITKAHTAAAQRVILAHVRAVLVEPPVLAPRKPRATKAAKKATRKVARKVAKKARTTR